MIAARCKPEVTSGGVSRRGVGILVAPHPMTKCGDHFFVGRNRFDRLLGYFSFLLILGIRWSFLRLRLRFCIAKKSKVKARKKEWNTNGLHSIISIPVQILKRAWTGLPKVGSREFFTALSYIGISLPLLFFENGGITVYRSSHPLR